MIKEAIDRITELAKPTLSEIDDRTYSDRPLHLISRPLAEPLTVHTLTALVEYLNRNLDMNDLKAVSGLFVHVESESRVSIQCALGAFDRQRETLLLAETYRSCEFPFERWLDQETFITNVLVHFIQTGAREDLMKIVGNLKGEEVRTAVDDGFTQRITAAAGVTKVAEVDIPNPIGLWPYRTFAEVAQPESLYVLRLRRQDGDLPLMALFPISDQRWREEAVEAIKSYLYESIDQDRLATIPILG